MSNYPELPNDLSGLADVETTGEWKPFWEGLAREKVLIQHCPACGHKQFYPRYLCTACGAEPAWTEFTGEATLYTYSVVRKHHQQPFKEMSPFVVAMVDLGEGVRMMSNLINCQLDKVHIGMPLTPVFVNARSDLPVLYWQPSQ